MDMQGEPIGGNQASTKHTTDPERYQNPTQEGAGAVASDSLAAESARSGGAFNENRDSNPQSVPGSKSTFANTDTSAATTLPPARDAQERDNIYRESGAGEKYPEGAGGQGNFSGSHAGGSYAGGSSEAKQEFGSSSRGDAYDTSGSGGAFSDGGADKPSADKISSSGQSHGLSGRGSGGDDSNSTDTSGQSYSSATSGSAGSNTPSGQNYTSSTSGSGGSNTGGDASAPGYVSSVTQLSAQGKPKGNVTEGSEEDFKGPNTQDAEIGSEQDPGRRAEQDFQRMTQSSAGSTAPKQGAQSGDSQYSMLEGDQQL